MGDEKSNTPPGGSGAANGQAGQAFSVKVDMNLAELTSDPLPSHTDSPANR